MRIGITGHRGLPADVAKQVRSSLVAHIEALDAADLVAISCIADGPDAWWAQIALDAGAKLEVVIPAVQYRDGQPDWYHSEYDQLLGSASDVHRTGLVESTSEAHQAGRKFSWVSPTSFSPFGTGSRPEASEELPTSSATPAKQVCP